MERTFIRDKLPSLFHRCLGQRIYMTDLDSLLTSHDQIENLTQEFSMQDDLSLIALIDYKHYNIKSISKKPPAIRAQIKMADKLEIPFFIVITYLDLATPMYFTVPMNDISKKFFTKYNQPLPGRWMTVKIFSQFQHTLRCLNWNPNDEIPFSERWNEELKLSNAPSYTLNDLPNEKVTYDLPDMKEL